MEKTKNCRVCKKGKMRGLLTKNHLPKNNKSQIFWCPECGVICQKDSDGFARYRQTPIAFRQGLEKAIHVVDDRLEMLKAVAGRKLNPAIKIDPIITAYTEELLVFLRAEAHRANSSICQCGKKGIPRIDGIQHVGVYCDKCWNAILEEKLNKDW